MWHDIRPWKLNAPGSAWIYSEFVLSADWRICNPTIYHKIVKTTVYSSSWKAVSNWEDFKYLLCPFHFQNEMVVTEAWHSCYGFGSILSTVEVDKRKTL